MTTAISKITLDKLVRSEKNIRRIDAGGTAELAASIQRDGLIQNLTVAKRSDGKYEVVAGARRLAALQLLVKQKKMAKTAAIPCRVVPLEESEAISLAENQLREPMHPVDQLEAFKARIDNGDTITDVASRFGVTETFVKQRLKLASVAPELLEDCRAGAMTLQQLQAFTVTDDTAAQIDLWSRVKGNQYASQPDWIKSDLLEAAVDSDDRRLKFIGRAAYQKAGGAIIAPDLFSAMGEDDEDLPAEVISDPDLLEKLALEKLERQAAKLQKAEGLAFVEVRTHHFNPYCETDLIQATVVRRAPSPEIEEQIRELVNARLEIRREQSLIDPNGDEGDAYDALVEKEEALDDHIERIEDSLKEIHPDELEHLGAVIYIDRDGKPVIERNIIRKEHKGKARPVNQATGDEESDDQIDEPESASYSEKLNLQLLTQKTAILRNEMMQHPSACLAVIVYHMIVEDYRTELGAPLRDTPLRTSKDWQQKPLEDTDASIATSEAALENKAAEDEALAELSQLLNAVRDEDPHQALLDYLLNSASNEQLMELLALCVTNRVDLRPQKNGSTAPERLLSTAFLTPLKINTYWSPTAENFFGHISKPLIIDAVTEAGAGDASALVDMKKQEAAEQAEQLVAGTGWLPSPMRIGEA